LTKSIAVPVALVNSPLSGGQVSQPDAIVAAGIYAADPPVREASRKARSRPNENAFSIRI